MNSPACIPLERYYRFHSHIYDATRWSFLFGRTALIREISHHIRPGRILEIGCGTGKNLVSLAGQFPDADIIGMDLSKDMLERAAGKFSDRQGRRPTLICGNYSQSLHTAPPYDLIVFSYTLSMINPGFRQAIGNARRDLAPGGMIAVVDFDDSPADWFKSWMKLNHVRMDGHLLPELNGLFEPARQTMIKAYEELWRYFMFIGITKKESGK
jgi:S-adenosylmethionine-diacylgycerolhomoserine-N-methlytransferase